MSAPRYRIPPKVLALLHEREMTCAKLARLSCLSERHVIRVLADHPQANARCRRRLIPWLTVGEVAQLNWPSFHAEQDKITQTEPTRPGTLLAVANDGKAPEGPGKDRHKPLMRNCAPPIAGLLDGFTASNTFPSPKNQTETRMPARAPRPVQTYEPNR